MAKLYISEGGKEAVYELFDDSPEVTVGRGASNAVQIADGHASKVHLVLRRVRGRWKLVDLESKNGTRVNGAYKNAHWLSQNDTLTVGSVVFRFDAEGEPSGPPPRMAVPVAAVAASAAGPAAAVARAAMPAVPRALPAVPRAAPPAVARAALAAPPRTAVPVPVPMAAPAAAPARAAPRRERDEGDDEDGERRGRFAPRKTGMSGGVMALLIILGVGLVVLLVSALMSNDNPNSVLRKKVKGLREAQRLEEALQALKTEAVPGATGYQQIQQEIMDIEGMIAQRAVSARWAEADAWRKKNLYLIATGGHGAGAWNPKDSPPPKEAAQRLREFIRLFGDTSIAKEIVNGKDENNMAYQRILRENQDPARDEKIAYNEIDTQIAPFVNSQRLGAAHALLSFSLQVERLNLSPAAYGAFETKVRERQDRLKVLAVEALEKALNEGALLARRGEKGMAKSTVDAVLAILQWPDADLRRRADEAMRAW
jgi:pSer/pThr/pTyr-binding forkhead associated (FHA) protein